MIDPNSEEPSTLPTARWSVWRTDDSGNMHDGMLLTNGECGLSTVPDGLFASFDAIERGAVQEKRSENGDCSEIIGSPDMVLEVVSDTSVKKDTEDLPLQYFAAGIQEYWLVDARKEPARFEIFRRDSKGFVAVKPLAGGWLKAAVFGCDFRLIKGLNRLGRAEYSLEQRASKGKKA